MRRHALWMLAVVLPCWIGCLDTVWLPDSSGFVFFRRDQSIVHYDLAAKKERVIAHCGWITTPRANARPAIRPDGRELAVVKHTASRTQETVQLLFSDVATGRLTRQSSPKELAGNSHFPSDSVTDSGIAFWSPNGEWILFQVVGRHDNQPAGRGQWQDSAAAESTTTLCLFHLGSETVHVFYDLQISEDFLMFGTSPFTADHRGFLAERQKMQPPERGGPGQRPGLEDLVLFVDWKSNQHRFSATPLARTAYARADREEQEEMRSRAEFGIHCSPLVWTPKHLRVPANEGWYLVNTHTLLIDFEPDEQRRRITELIKPLGGRYLFLSDQYLVRAQTVTRPKPLADSGQSPTERIELCSYELGQSGLRVQPTWSDEVESVWFLHLSPNGQYALVLAETKTRWKRYVFDRQGRVVAELSEPLPSPSESSRRAADPAPPAQGLPLERRKENPEHARPPSEASPIPGSVVAPPSGASRLPLPPKADPSR